MGTRLYRLGVCAGLALAACRAQDDEPPQVVSLQALQGDGDESPFSGQTVRVVGAQVTAMQRAGFYIQDSTDYGVYVYDSALQPAVGDTVDLTGSISEFHGLTELSHLASHSSITSSGNPALAPLVVATGAVGERHEAVLVSVTGTCVQHDIGHGEWTIDDGSGLLVVDDLLSNGRLTAEYNTRFQLVGIAVWSFGAFKIEPTEFVRLGPGDLVGPEQVYVPPPPPPPSPAALAAAADQCPSLAGAAFDARADREVLRIGTMNAEWLFDGVADPSPSPWHAGSTDCPGKANGLNECDAAGATAHLERVAVRNTHPFLGSF